VVSGILAQNENTAADRPPRHATTALPHFKSTSISLLPSAGISKVMPDVPAFSYFSGIERFSCFADKGTSCCAGSIEAAGAITLLMPTV